MKIDKNLLPLKMHFFCFMSSVGPILPFLVVLGKQLGISEVLMGTINGILPLLYFVIKPLAGYVMDYFPKRRTLIFTSSIVLSTIFTSLIYFTLPSYEASDLNLFHPVNFTNANCSSSICQNRTDISGVDNRNDGISTDNGWLDERIKEEDHQSNRVLLFLIFMSISCIMFNVCNSYSDTICFDILDKGNEMDYGKQRVWGAIGYGITGCLTGILVDKFSDNSDLKNHGPAFILLLIFSIADILISLTLQPPVQCSPPNIFKDVKTVLKNPDVAWFMFLALIFGICDSFAVYYLLWYLEDISFKTSVYSKIRSIEGLILLCQTIFGEFVFFHFSGNIIEKIGYNNSFILCLVGYGSRFGLLSVIPTVWWAIPIESIFQGSYALSYTLIVSYTNHISTPGIRATMQSVSMAVFDGFGYAVGSFLGGIFLKYLGGRYTFGLVSVMCLTTAAFTVMVFFCLHWSRKFNKGTNGYRQI